MPRIFAIVKTIMSIQFSRKKKIGFFFYSHPRSIQNIAHHIQSKKDGVISEGGGGLHVLKWEKANSLAGLINFFRFDYRVFCRDENSRKGYFKQLIFQ